MCPLGTASEGQSKLQLLESTVTAPVCLFHLRCDPMRITKKFTGKARLGKKLYKGSDTIFDTPRLRENAASHLQVIRCTNRASFWILVLRVLKAKFLSAKGSTYILLHILFNNSKKSS